MGDVLATLVIYEGQYEVRHSREDGIGVSKFVAIDDVASAFSREPIDSGWIPSCVVRIGRCRSGPFVVARFPPTRYTCGLDRPDGSVEPLTVPLPGLVIFGCGTSYSVWAIAGSKFRPDAPALHAPFPNVGHEGAICFGSHVPPRASGLTIQAACELFLGTSFNDHQIAGKSRAHHEDVRRQLRAVAGKNRYPVLDLVQMGTTIEKLVRWQVDR
ncbi:MAG: hypothetical protein U0166_02635 [Acidobacteriota bacterium]